MSTSQYRSIMTLRSFVRGCPPAAEKLSRGLLSVINPLYRAYSLQQRPAVICRGCGSPISSDSSKPGYFLERKALSSNQLIRDKRKMEESEIFSRTIADLDDSTKEAILPQDAVHLEHNKSGKKPSRSLCTRCHSLEHHSSVPIEIQEQKASQFDIFSKLRHDQEAMIVNVIDVMDFPLSLLHLRKHIGSGHRIIHVFNRVDILHRNPLIVQKLRTRLTSMLQDQLETDLKLDVRLVSALKGWEVEKLANSLKMRRSGTNIFFVGSANAGKSSLISTLGRRSTSGTLHSPTTSHVPGTTLAPIPTEIELFGEILGRGRGSVVDLPGVLKPGLSEFIHPGTLRQSLPHKHLQAKPISLRQGESLILGDVIQIEHVSGDEKHILVTPYTHLGIHCTSRPEHILEKPSNTRTKSAPAFATALEYEVRAVKGGANVLDVVLKDIGFVSVALWKGSSKIKVSTPGGLHVGVRPSSLIENSYVGI